MELKGIEGGDRKRGVGGETRRQKSFRIGVHHASAVVWEPVYRTRLTDRLGVRHRRRRLFFERHRRQRLSPFLLLLHHHLDVRDLHGVEVLAAARDAPVRHREDRVSVRERLQILERRHELGVPRDAPRERVARDRERDGDVGAELGERDVRRGRC